MMTRAKFLAILGAALPFLKLLVPSKPDLFPYDPGATYTTAPDGWMNADPITMEDLERTMAELDRHLAIHARVMAAHREAWTRDLLTLTEELPR